MICFQMVPYFSSSLSCSIAPALDGAGFHLPTPSSSPPARTLPAFSTIYVYTQGHGAAQNLKDGLVQSWGFRVNIYGNSTSRPWRSLTAFPKSLSPLSEQAQRKDECCHTDATARSPEVIPEPASSLLPTDTVWGTPAAPHLILLFTL